MNPFKDGEVGYLVIAMNHSVMFQVVAYLAESGLAKSGEVAESLKISRKHASMVLSRCYRRGFVSRQPYRRGRVRGYVNKSTDKGVEWLHYKASQKKNEDLHDRKPTIEVGNESIHPPRFEMLNLEQNQQTSKDFMPIKAGFTMWALQAVNTCAREYQSLKQWYDLAIILLMQRSSEADSIYYLYRELEERLELLEKPQHRETAPSLESFCKGWRQGLDRGLELGLKLGTQIGETRRLLRTQVLINKTLLTKEISKLRIQRSMMREQACS